MREPGRLRLTAAPPLVALLLLVAACAPNPPLTLTPTNHLSTAPGNPTGNHIKIGFITALTGQAAGYGARQKIAVQLAVEDVNNAGGINGSPLQVVMVDDAANPREDVSLVRRLATEDRALAIIGPLTSASFEAAGPLANEIKIPLITASPSKPGLTEQNRPWVFHFSVPDAAVTPKAIEGFKRLYPNARKMVISGDTKDPVHEDIIKNLYPKALKDAGLQVVDTVPFETGTSDFSAVVTRIKGLNPEGIAYSSSTPEAIGFARELQRQGIKAPVVASFQNWCGPEIVLGKEVIEGWVSGGTFDEDSQDPRARAYLERFVRIGEADPAVGKPAYSGVWTQTYDAVMALAEVLGKGQVTPDMDLQKARTAIPQGLQNLKGFQGITGEISVLPNGEITTTPLAFVARGGKWALIK